MSWLSLSLLKEATGEKEQKLMIGTVVFICLLKYLTIYHLLYLAQIEIDILSTRVWPLPPTNGDTVER